MHWYQDQDVKIPMDLSAFALAMKVIFQMVKRWLKKTEQLSNVLRNVEKM